MNNECQGCQALLRDGNCTNGLDQNMPKDHLCPCMNCIIKVICEEECEEFLRYLKTYSPSLFTLYRRNKDEQ